MGPGRRPVYCPRVFPGPRGSGILGALRPPRADIAIPPFPAGTEWIGDQPGAVERIAARAPVLVHFFDFAQLNSVRALPYVVEWRRRYAEHGLTVLGVHLARYPFTDDAAEIEAALGRLGIGWPVARDADKTIARDYGAQGWPSLFLWGRGGVLCWYHLGEGDYAATEEAIREALAEDSGDGADVLSMPPLMEPLRLTDAPGAEVVVPTEESFPGFRGKPWRAGEHGESIELTYEAGGAYLTAEGSGDVLVWLDGKPRDAIRIERSGLHPIAEHARHEKHSLALEPSHGLAVHSIQFAPGVRV